MNRAILSEMLGDDYHIMEAVDGSQAVALLQKHNVSIDLVLLDIVMPVMDGYGVLEVMKNKGWIEDTPVIMISAENNPALIERAYNLGVSDFISRPFDASIVRHRVVNTIMLYTKQKKLAGMIADQIYEKEKNSNLMINILSHIVEFRNGESGLHILHVQTFTELLLNRLLQITDRYDLSASDIKLISTAAALHDIGKISIPDEILNKPGKLTKEEFEIMKTHSAVGASMLDELPYYKEEPLVKVGHDICRWHHERYDGRGYPDGLKGEDIPISAQVVALADVYDALTSERVYKKAFSHEEAVRMILNGECGAFNPVLLECLKESEETIRNEIKEKTLCRISNAEMKSVEAELFHYDELSVSKRTLQMLEYEQIKNEFFDSISRRIQFEYVLDPALTKLSVYGAKHLGMQEITVDPVHDPQTLETLGRENLDRLIKIARSTTPEEPLFRYSCRLKIDGEPQEVQIIGRTMWSNGNPPRYTGLIGELVLSGVDNADQ